ncbi:MAG: STAS domain-containing protein [Candidatus Gastranaerophilales bacterium]|nr:STAS domain-containing protein [Candidatus Gastranaerophilales bacterium]
MKIESEKKERSLVLKLSGRLETTTAPELQKVVDNELEGIEEVVIDMEQLAYVSSAGLRVLLAASKKMTAKQGSLIVCHVGEDIMDVFEITGFNEILDIR